MKENNIRPQDLFDELINTSSIRYSKISIR